MVPIRGLCEIAIHVSQMRGHAQMLEFRIGDRVSFQPDDRPMVTGMLVRDNRKSVTVITDSGQRWNVAPSFLRRADDARGADRPAPRMVQLHKR